MYENRWRELKVPVEDIEALVLDAEQKQYGRLGNDNLYILIPAFDAQVFQTGESDIHLSFSTDNLFVNTVLERWDVNQWMFAKKKRT